MQIIIKLISPISEHDKKFNGITQMVWGNFSNRDFEEYLYDNTDNMDTPGLYYSTKGYYETTYYIVGEDKQITSFDMIESKVGEYLQLENMIRSQELLNKSWTDIAKHITDFSGILAL